MKSVEMKLSALLLLVCQLAKDIVTTQELKQVEFALHFGYGQSKASGLAAIGIADLRSDEGWFIGIGMGRFDSREAERR